MSRSSYICDRAACTELDREPTHHSRYDHCWHESLWRRLVWQYGDSKATTIALGLDRTTQRDLAAWNGLGA